MEFQCSPVFIRAHRWSCAKPVECSTCPCIVFKFHFNITLIYMFCLLLLSSPQVCSSEIVSATAVVKYFARVFYWSTSRDSSSEVLCASVLENRDYGTLTMRQLYLPRDRHLSAKLVPTFAAAGYHVVSVTNPYGRITGLLDRYIYIYIYIYK
jgi:hypothetical protein